MVHCSLGIALFDGVLKVLMDFGIVGVEFGSRVAPGLGYMI